MFNTSFRNREFSIRPKNRRGNFDRSSGSKHGMKLDLNATHPKAIDSTAPNAYSVMSNS